MGRRYNHTRDQEEGPEKEKSSEGKEKVYVRRGIQEKDV